MRIERIADPQRQAARGHIYISAFLCRRAGSTLDTIQQPDEVKAIIIYSEAFRQQPTPQSVKTLLGRTNKWQLIEYCCSLSALMHTNEQTSMTPLWQAQHIQHLGSALGAKRALELMSSGRLVFHEAQLGLIVRYALAFGREDETLGDFGAHILRLATSINELYTDVEIPKEASDAEKRRAFFKLELQSAVIPNQRFAHVVQRFYRFFEHLRSLAIRARCRFGRPG